MPGRVADASVLGALFFKEPRADEAEMMVNGLDLFEPTILAYELASIARKKVVADPGRREFITSALESGLGWNVKWMDADHLAVLALAVETGLSTYDASYLHVAKVMDAPLVTFDGKLRRAAHEVLGSR